jgi:hypothetical protein
MNFKNTLAAICGVPVLILSLISCNSKDALTKPGASKPWGMAEPVIVSVDGKYERQCHLFYR